MPAVAANKHLDNIRRERQEREARRNNAARAAKPASDGPIRAGQSVVRRGNGAPRGPIVLSGDSDLDASDPEELLDPAFYRRIDRARDNDSVDPVAIAQRYPGWSDSSGGDDNHDNDNENDDDRLETVTISDESEDDLRDGDLRDWLERPGAPKANSVVDQMLSRTKAKTRARPRGGIGGGRGRRRGLGSPRLVQQRLSVPRREARPDVEPSPAPPSGPNFIQLGPMDKPSKSKQKRKPTGTGIRRMAVRRPRPVFLDDDSIFGDFDDGPEAIRAESRRQPLPPMTHSNSPRTAPFRPPILKNGQSPLPRNQSPAPRGPARPVGGGGPSPRRQPLHAPGALALRHVAAGSFVAPIAPAAPAVLPIIVDGVSWSSYERFSIDFDIRPLPLALKFAADTDLGSGRLTQLLALAQIMEGDHKPSVPEACSFSNLVLAPGMTETELALVFPLVTDRLFELLERTRVSSESAAGEEADELAEEEMGARKALRFVLSFVSMRPMTNAEELERFRSSIFSALDHFFGRLEGAVVPTSSGQAAETRVFFLIHWFAVEVSARFGLLEKTAGRPWTDGRDNYAVLLVRRLLEHGFNRTVKSVKQAALALNDPDAVEGQRLRDCTAECWVGLIHLLPIFDSENDSGDRVAGSIWPVVVRAFEQTGFQQTGLLAAERMWYLVLGLCSISLFSPAGRAQSDPSLQAHWPFIVKAVMCVQLASDSVADKASPAAALIKRDHYVWTVLARCHLLTSRWGWKFDLIGAIFAPLVTSIFKSRKYTKLHSDPTADFPLFIREADMTLVWAIDNDLDSAFDVYLKLMASAARDMREATHAGTVTDAQVDRAITRMLSGSAPLAKISFTRASPPTMRELSMLINRYSFTMVSVLLNPSPANSAHALRQMRSFLTFAEADFKSRKVCVRALMYMGVLHRQFGIDLREVTEWVGELVNLLLQELASVDRPLGSLPLIRHSSGTKIPAPVAKTPKAEIKMLILLILAAIRHIIDAPSKDPGVAEYPDPRLLHSCALDSSASAPPSLARTATVLTRNLVFYSSAWIEGVLASSLSLEPSTGNEVLRCVQAFLTARQLALPPPRGAEPPPAGDSQDEYGAEFGMIDFDDPALQALLDGTDVASAAAAAAAGPSAASLIVEKDKLLVDKVKSTISPAMYKLVSKFAGQEEGTGLGPEGAAYVAGLVNCWAGCASVLVQHGARVSNDIVLRNACGSPC